VREQHANDNGSSDSEECTREDEPFSSTLKSNERCTPRPEFLVSLQPLCALLGGLRSEQSGRSCAIQQQPARVLILQCFLACLLIPA
jgi:hypothetical protein